MSNAILFLMGFASITTVFEIAKTGKKTNSQKLQRAVELGKKALK